MSTLLENEEVQWEDPLTDIFSQSACSFDIPSLHWDIELDGLDGDSTMHETSIVSATTQPASHEILGGSESPSQASVPGPKPKAKKGKKGRPKTIFDHGSQSAVDRRRTQVRLAQRAYRNRKEATVASLRNDVDDLKARLIGMENTANELFDVTGSLSYLPETAKCTIQSLHKRLEQYRLPLHLRSTVQTAEGTVPFSVCKASDTGDIPISKDIPIECSDSRFSNGSLKADQSATQLSPPTSVIDQSPYTFNSFKNPPEPQADFGSSISVFASFNETLLKFSLRLRHEALRGAYNLAKKPETPYKVLCRVFRYCIFSCTREEIIRHLDFLIQESAKTTYQTLASTVLSDADSVSNKSFSRPQFYSTIESAKMETSDAYMSPEGVTNYLQYRGLAIDPELSFVEFTITPGNLFGSASTLFDEIRQKKKIRVSASKLQYELMARMVCLAVGPGIRASKIDEAIRSTVIAAI